MLFKNNKGFSISELLVSISILAIITSFSIVNFNTWKKNEDLRQSTRELANNIRAIQTKSLSGEMIDGDLPSGYGIYFSNTALSSYILFADLDNNYIYDGGELINDCSLTNNVLISNLIPVDSNGDLTIIFKTPNAKIYINQNILDDNALIELTHNITNNSETVETRRITGRIDIQ